MQDADGGDFPVVSFSARLSGDFKDVRGNIVDQILATDMQVTRGIKEMACG